MKIFLDDERSPEMVFQPTQSQDWNIVSSLGELKALINTIDISEVTEMSFDHDIGYDPMTIKPLPDGSMCASVFLWY